MASDHCGNCGHHLAHHSAHRGECNYFPPDDLFCSCQHYEEPDAAMASREVLERAFDLIAGQPYQPNPYDRLMTEALDSAEETGRAKERARFQALLDEWETSEPGTPMLAVMGLRRALARPTSAGLPGDDRGGQGR